MTDKDIDAVPSITLEQDDILQRNAQRKPARQPRSNDAFDIGAQDGEKISAHVAMQPGLPVWIKAALALLCLLAAIWIVYLQKQQQQSAMLLQQAEQRIVVLEQKLSSTDSSMLESEAALVAKIKSIDELIDVNKSEIRKLWGVSYDTNKKAIAVNAEQNSKQASALKELEKKQKTALDDLVKLQKALAAAEANAKNSVNLAKEASQRLELLQESFSAIEQNSKTGQAERATLMQRLAAAEELLKSVDLSRSNLVNDIRQIKEEIRKAQASQPAQAF